MLFCFACNLYNEDFVTVSFELPDGSVIQSDDMLVEDAEDLLLNWITD